ncbi:hypothetical protein [Altibacter lentus]|uniref:hypothetical protein n=1 Tax=Altibacter lentus TaxID=1223410 RepID=UPI0005523E2D|nr:hypothetical protein [Altibacter lentus]
MKNLIFLFLTATTIVFFSSCSSNDESDSSQDIIFEIGDAYQGGIIFYIDSTGEHGLIAATVDLPKATWGCIGNTSPIAQNQEIGSGITNTLAILSNCSEPGIAARVASEFDFNGYTDWFLPSINELALLYEHREIIGGFDESEGAIYSSSTEFFPVGTGEHLNYWVYDFGVSPVIPDARKLNTNKETPSIIRVIRSF